MDRIPPDDDVVFAVDVLGWMAHWLRYGLNSQPLEVYVSHGLSFHIRHLRWNNAIGDYEEGDQ